MKDFKFIELLFQGIPYEKKEESKIQAMSREYSEQNTKFNKLQSHVPPKLFLAYWFHVSRKTLIQFEVFFFQVVFRLIIDVLFTVYQFRIFIYKFVMPEVFQCSEFPCKGGMESEDNVSFADKLAYFGKIFFRLLRVTLLLQSSEQFLSIFILEQPFVPCFWQCLIFTQL